MYERGDLRTIPPPCETTDEDGYCDESWDADHKHRLTDSRRRDKDNRYVEWSAGTAFLPHSCDEWIIGGPEQIRALIEDLQALLESPTPQP